MKISLPLAALATLVILGADGFTSVVLAEDPPKTYRRYDDAGRFDGTTREDEEGNLRFYNEKGEYEGRAFRKKDGSWRRYDENGEFEGTIREESD
jgi:hypothetical protein